MELEGRFRSLHADLLGFRIDVQWRERDTASGLVTEDRYSIAGAKSFSAVHQFQALAEHAGQKLLELESHPEAPIPPTVFDEPGLTRRWYRALKDVGSAFGGLSYASDGAGLLYFGHLRDPALESATLCLRLSQFGSLAAARPTSDVSLPPGHAEWTDKEWIEHFVKELSGAHGFPRNQSLPGTYASMRGCAISAAGVGAVITQLPPGLTGDALVNQEAIIRNLSLIREGKLAESARPVEVSVAWYRRLWIWALEHIVVTVVTGVLVTVLVAMILHGLGIG